MRLAMMLALILVSLSACTFREAVFGKPCASDVDCPDPYRCFRGACVPDDFPDEEVPPPDGGNPDGGNPDGADGDRCVDAIRIELDQIVEGSTVLSRDDLAAPCAEPGAPENFYALELTEPTSIIARLEPSSYDAVLFASSGCSPQEIIANTCVDDPNDNFAVESIAIPGAGPGTIYFVVDGAPGGIAPAFGPYRLIVERIGACEGNTVPLGQRCIGRLGTAEMATSRTNATATTLLDGRVLVAGGRSGSIVVTTGSAEIFDPVTRTFSQTPPMNEGRARHAAVLLEDGRVAVFGGVVGSRGNYTATASAEVYDPDLDTWSPLPTLASGRDLFTATRLLDGRILIVGGRDGDQTLSDVFIFDGDTYAQILPGLAEARFGHTATLLDDGDVLIAGGRVGSSSITLDHAERFDIQTNTVVDADFALESRGGHTATTTDLGMILIAGGFQRSDPTETIGLAGVDIYNPFLDDWDFVSDLNQPRLFATSVLFDGEGVVLLGGDADAPLSTVEIYREETDEWILLPSLATPRLAAAGAKLDESTVLVVGGDGGTGVELPLSSAEIYGFVD